LGHVGLVAVYQKECGSVCMSACPYSMGA